MNIPNNCKQIINDPKIVFRENISKIVFLNTNRENIVVIRVDGCVIEDGVRCDFLLINIAQKEHFVELKGSDLDHAVSQIERTINLLSIDKRNVPKCCFIISSRCPLLTTKIQELKIKFKRRYNSALIIKNRYHEHVI